jgi:hypothetical protein
MCEINSNPNAENHVFGEFTDTRYNEYFMEFLLWFFVRDWRKGNGERVGTKGRV